MPEAADATARPHLVRSTSIALGALVLAVAALGCGDDGGGESPIAGSLRFGVEPAPTGDAFAFTPIDPQGTPEAITVEVLDEDGVLIPDATDAVTLSLGASPGSLLLHATGTEDPNTTDPDGEVNSRLLELIDTDPSAVPARRFVLERNWRLDGPTSIAYDASTDDYLVNIGRVDNLYAGDVRTGEADLIDGGGTTNEIAGMGFEVLDGTAEPDTAPRLLAVKNRWAGDTIEALYAIDPATGAESLVGLLTVLPDSDGQAGVSYFTGLAVDPTDGTIFASAFMTLVAYDGTVLLTIDPDTLEVTIVGDMEQFVSSLGAGPDGTLYAVLALKQDLGGPEREERPDGPELVSVDKATGALSPLSPRVLLDYGDAGDAIAAVPARISGTTTVSATNGVATFDDVKIDAVGDGYTLVATASGRASATSSAFAVATPALVSDVAVTTSTDTVDETDGGFDVIVTATPPPPHDLYVTLATGGTAADVNDASPDTDLDHLDYFQIIVPAGDDDGIVTRTVSIVDDDEFEQDETVELHVKDASLATSITGPRLLTVTLTSDDPEPDDE